ncbi:hypothetical protein EDC01DRAFT_621512 [Geopyxis carbonaria]|nr:hypothetical protein EDC01DRAFT_621512 [Geopyxis carbonaria]
MSTMWLNKKKKGELVALCDHLGLETDGYLKSDLENILTEYLEAHQNELSTDSLLAPYYDTVISTRSPIKSTAAHHELPEKRTRRRTSRYTVLTQLNISEESTPEPAIINERTTRSGSRALAARTPRTVRTIRDAAYVPLPPSPAVVANEIESRTNQIVASAFEAIEIVEITQKAIGLRDRLSNVISVNAIALTLEVSFLFISVIPLTYEVTIPGIPTLGTHNKIFVLPDLFVLLTSAFWSPFLTWLMTAIIGPFINASLFNLVAATVAVKDGSEYKADPLTFAVTKALLVYLVHYKDFFFWGLCNPKSVQIVGNSVGRELQLVAAGIAGLAAIWEGILRR